MGKQPSVSVSVGCFIYLKLSFIQSRPVLDHLFQLIKAMPHLSLG